MRLRRLTISVTDLSLNFYVHRENIRHHTAFDSPQSSSFVHVPAAIDNVTQGYTAAGMKSAFFFGYVLLLLTQVRGSRVHMR